MVNVDSLDAVDALPLASPGLDILKWEFDVRFPVNPATKKAGLVFTHDGDNSY